MPKQMHLSAFSHHASSSQSFGQWKDPRNTMARGYLDPEYWVNVAKTCERGCFDTLFLADAPGAKDIYGGGHRMTAKAGMQFPGNDPTFLPPVLARETEHLGFIVTFATGYFPPYHTARVFSTLDHMTGGRIGWNIVTGYMKAALRNGMAGEVSHDERYDRADEYMEVVYKLWEQSWRDDAIVLDIETSTYAELMPATMAFVTPLPPRGITATLLSTQRQALGVTPSTTRMGQLRAWPAARRRRTVRPSAPSTAPMIPRASPEISPVRFRPSRKEAIS
jgi:alkanesulfonate monooxygenase SsuD/methylene tetrahydromethanopterin reductase-like flavin-dependent oxidoreductase (luciferase family)